MNDVFVEGMFQPVVMFVEEKGGNPQICENGVLH